MSVYFRAKKINHLYSDTPSLIYQQYKEQKYCQLYQPCFTPFSPLFVSFVYNSTRHNISFLYIFRTPGFRFLLQRSQIPFCNSPF